MSAGLRSLVEWAAVIGGALVVALLVKTFLFQAFFIPSASMVPTLNEGDRIVVNKLSYDLGDLDRGDIVVFERPPQLGAVSPGIQDFIKRVVGLPGDRLEAIGGVLHLNGRPLEEPYLPPGAVTNDLAPTVVPEGHVFVMGDNRGHSNDSRTFGPIPEELVVGRAFVRLWPLTDLAFL